MEFINWDAKRKGFLTSGKTREQMEQLVATKRPPEIEALVEALTRLWGRLGVHEICSDCFAGKLNAGHRIHGCCGHCPSLGPDKCHAKPVGCAVFVCGDVWVRLERKSNYEQVRDVLNKLLQSYWLHRGFFDQGYERETSLPYTPEQLARAVVLTKEIEAI